MFCHVARISLAEGAALHLLADFWSLHSWFAIDGDVLASNSRVQGSYSGRGEASGGQWWPCEYSVHISESRSDVGPNFACAHDLEADGVIGTLAICFSLSSLLTVTS